MKDRIKRPVQLFFTSSSIFIYQILILRVFSVLFEQELLFLMISLAVLGLGVGGILYKLEGGLFWCWRVRVEKYLEM